MSGNIEIITKEPAFLLHVCDHHGPAKPFSKNRLTFVSWTTKFSMHPASDSREKLLTNSFPNIRVQLQMGYDDSSQQTVASNRFLE